MENIDGILIDLGVDIDLHNQLIESMRILHQKTHLSRSLRPDSMGFFDDAFHNAHFKRVKELYEFKENGGKIIGTFCIYVPDEIAYAADVIPAALCGGSGWPVSYADKMLPRDICPLIRSTFGMAFSNTCPYKKLKSFAVGETTCDAKKKAWDLFGFKVLEVPQKKNQIDKELWRQEVFAFKEMIENLAEKKITEEKLSDSIKLVNKKRRLLTQINEFRKLPEPPINGVDALLISQLALSMDINNFNNAAEVLINELHQRVEKGISAYDRDGKRTMIAGSPSPMGNAKIHHIAESVGFQIVADESCTGSRYYRDLVDESQTDLESMINAIADRYFKIDCACFSPNTERLENIKKIIEEYKVKSVIHNILQYCHAYNIEAKMLENSLKKACIPSIKIETDYSEEDTEQIKTRVEAFYEMI